MGTTQLFFGDIFAIYVYVRLCLCLLCEEFLKLKTSKILKFKMHHLPRKMEVTIRSFYIFNTMYGQKEGKVNYM